MTEYEQNVLRAQRVYFQVRYKTGYVSLYPRVRHAHRIREQGRTRARTYSYTLIFIFTKLDIGA